MTDQAPNIDLKPGGGRLVYDKQRRTIIAERDVVERLERFAREGAGVAVLIDAAAEIKQLRSEVQRLNAVRTAGNPYPHGSELFVAFEQARSPAFT